MLTNDRPLPIKQALDAQLSGLRTSPLQREVLFQQATGGKRMKRKLTAGLVLALILILTALTAVAMELTGWSVLEWLSPPTQSTLSASTPITQGSTEHRVADIHLREAVTDGYGVYLSLAITPKEEGTLVLSNAIDPFYNKAVQLGVTPDFEDQTVAQWATAHGYHKLYQISCGGQRTTDEVGNTILHDYFDAHNNPMRILDDGTTLWMMACAYQGEEHLYKLCYRILTFPPDIQTYHAVYSESALGNMIAEHDDYEQRVLTFTVAPPDETSIDLVAEYRPSPDAHQPEEYPRVEYIRLLRSPLTDYYDVAYTHPPASKKKSNTIGEPRFFNLDLFSPDVWMKREYEELLPDGTVEKHYVRTHCTIPETPPEQFSVICTIDYEVPPYDDDPDTGHAIDYNTLTLNRVQ